MEHGGPDYSRSGTSEELYYPQRGRKVSCLDGATNEASPYGKPINMFGQPILHVGRLPMPHSSFADPPALYVIIAVSLSVLSLLQEIVFSVDR